MKARFLALAALVLGLASCQTEPEGLNVNVGGEVDTTVCVSLPEATRANSAEGAFANLNLETSDLTIRYIFEVYYSNTGVQKQVYYTDEKTANFPVRLVPGRDYNFVAWADIVTMPQGVDAETALPYEDTDVYYETSDLKNITIIDSNNEWKAMDETRDAYTGFYNTASKGDNNKYTGTSSINIQMTRPFAKLRVITTDMKELNALIITPTNAKVEYRTDLYNSFNAVAGTVNNTKTSKTHEFFNIETYEDNEYNKSMVLFTDYIFATEDQEVVNFTLAVKDQNDVLIGETINFSTPIPAQRNYLTTIQGNVLTDGNNITVKVEDAFEGNVDYDADKDKTTTTVNTAEELAAAFENDSPIDVVVLNGDIDLNDLLTRANDVTLTIASGKTLTIDLNDNKLSATSSQTGTNYNMFDVRGILTVKNGTIEYKHEGENMGWNNSTNLFNVTAGGVLNLEGVTAKNLGGSDMGFVAHLNNWGEVTLNVENCTLESNYVPVRVFNSGYDMNNVTIKNSTLNGVSAAFWVHNYTVADFGTEAKAEAQKALLNFDIYNGTNTFSPDLNGIRYGFTNSVRTDAYGIIKTVSEDGTEVTLGSIIENGLIRRGVAGAEENTTIKKVVVEEGVGVLYDRTFRHFYALEEVVLPSTLTVLGANGDDYYSNGNVFQGCAALKNIVIPESVTTMGPGVFYGCSSLESINIPAGVTRIERDALRETGLKKVEFPASVTYFGNMAFRDCKQLTEVVINAPEFTMEGNTFGIMAAPFTPMTIYVANDEMKAYVESKLTAHDKTYITVKAPTGVTDKASLQAALKTAIAAGEKNIYIDGTNFSGDLNYGLTQAMVPAGTTVTIRNANVEGKSYGNGANGTVIFEGCTFNNSGAYSIHFDNGNGNVIFKNCDLYGWNSFGASLTSVEFENCSLTGNGTYALIRSYADLSLKNCTIDTTSANHTDKYSEGVEAIEATLTEENVTYIVNNANYLASALAAGKNVTMNGDITASANDTTANSGYGATGVKVENGAVLDGNGKTLTINNAWDTWDCTVAATNGTIKNLTINGAMRGIFMPGADGDVVIDNVIFNNVIYTFNSDAGNKNYGVYISNSTLNGWTSHSDVHKEVIYTNCKFGEGNGYAYCRPYGRTEFVGCAFEAGFEVDAIGVITFENCTIGGVALTAENLATLVTSGLANASVK